MRRSLYSTFRWYRASSSSERAVRRIPSMLCAVKPSNTSTSLSQSTSTPTRWDGYNAAISVRRVETPMYPKARGYARVDIIEAPRSGETRSSLLITPIVRKPDGSTVRACCRASEFARSTSAGHTARIRVRGGDMYLAQRDEMRGLSSRGWFADVTYWIDKALAGSH